MTDHTPFNENASAHAQTSRRAVLQGAPVAAMALAAGGMASADERGSLSPIMKLFREWQRLHAAAGDRGITEERCEAICDQYHALEFQMLALPSTSAADFAAKLCAYTSFGAFDLTENVAPELWAEANELLAA